MNNNKRILCYNIISYIGGLFDYDMSDLTDDEIVKMVESLEKLSYERLLQFYELLWDMFKEKFEFDKEEF